MQKIVYSDREKNDLTSLYERGYSITFLAKLYETSTNTILRVLREWGVYRWQNKIIDPNKILVDLDTEKHLLRLFNDGVSMHNMEKIVGLRTKAISIILSRHNLRREIPKETKVAYVQKYVRKLKALGKRPSTAEQRKRWSKASKQRHRESIRRKNKEYSIRNRAKITKRHREKRRANPSLRVIDDLRNRIYRLVVLGDKAAPTMELIGCSREFLINHLEKQFTTVPLDNGEEFKMSWDNYKLHGWHIDHIRPCVSFDLTDPEQQKECFHWSNLRPLYYQDNISRRYNAYFQQNNELSS